MIPQNIRIKVDENVYVAIGEGKKTFIITSAEVEEGDYITFINTNKSNNKEPIIKQVGYIEDNVSEDINRIIGLLPPMYGTLAPFFEEHKFILGYGIQITGHKYTEISPSVYLPPLTTPPIPFEQVAPLIAIDNWPDGYYSITLQAMEGKKDQLEQQIELAEMLVYVSVKDENGVVFVEVDQAHLYAGTVKDTAGNTLEPYIGFNENEDEEDLSELTKKLIKEVKGENYNEADEKTDIEEWAAEQVSDIVDTASKVPI